MLASVMTTQNVCGVAWGRPILEVVVMWDEWAGIGHGCFV